MMRYADPQSCPDCRTAITPGAAACGVCALSLRGETAQRLFGTLTLADELLVTLRAASTFTVATVAAPAQPARFPPGPAPDAATATATAHPRRGGLSAASVPTILLGLGAACVLVAAMVFLAVAWSVLGVGGRTATLVVLTVVAATVASWTARRGLRAATESLTLVGCGLLTLDLTGANQTGWLGDLSAAGFLVLLGVVLTAAGAGAAVAARRTSVPRLSGAEVVGAVGIALATLGVGGAEWLPVAPSLVLATLLAAALAAAARRLRLVVTGTGSALVTAGAWVSLTGYAVDRTLTHDTSWRTLWLTLEVWPLLAATALAAGPILARRLPVPVRVGAGAVAHSLLGYALLAPVVHLTPTEITLVALGVLAVTGTATWWLSRPWGLANLLTQGVTAGGVLVVVLSRAVDAVDRVGDTVGAVWSGRAGDLLPTAARAADQPAPWLLPLCVVALVGTARVLSRAGVIVDRLAAPVADLRAGATVLGGSCVAALALYPVPLWLVVGALLVLVTGFTAWWLVGGSTLPLVPAAVFVTVAVGVSLHADRLTAGALLALLTFTALVHLRCRSTELAAVVGAVLAATVAGSAWTWGALADIEPTWVVLAGLVSLGALVLIAPYAPGRWWASPEPFARAGAEVGAAAAAVPLVLAGVLLAPAGESGSWAAVYLTTAGVAVSAMSLLRTGRRALGWLGGGLLAAATWVRLADLGVHAPEAYTLPSALVLLVVGLAHLRRTPEASTMRALSAGLSLALMPSLLWALADPSGARVLLLGAGCLLLVLTGARIGWTAPVVLGAGVGALLVLRLATPYVGDAVPRWVLIGAAGALLITVGATWEQRLGEARHLVSAVRALR